MTYKEKYKSLKESEWLTKIKIVYLYHKKKKKQKFKHKVFDTASYFEISSALASQSINLVNHLDKIKGCKSMNQALKFLRLPD